MPNNKSDLAQISFDPEESRQNNAQAPPSRLPPEIWGDIMCLYRDVCISLDAELNVDEREPLPPFIWIAVAQVCHWWRQIALGIPVLWNHIILHANRQQSVNPNRRTMISELLQRSGECPMTFIGRGLFDLIDMTEITFILENIHRFRHFSITMGPSAHLLPPFTASPRLEVFHFRLHSGPRDFPLLFSKSDFPKIRDIELHQLTFNTFSPFLRSTLTKVSLIWCKFEDQDCNMFLYSLEEMSGLRELLLSSIEIPIFDPHKISRNLHLPNLQRLTIVANNDSSIMRLLVRISVPHDAQLLFHFCYGYSRPHLKWREFEQFVHAIGNFFHSNVIGGVPTFRTVRLRSGGGVSLFAWHEELSGESRLGMVDEKPNLKLIVSMAGTMDSQASSFRLLCGSLPLSAVRTGFFVIPYRVIPLSSSWHGFLNTMAEIRHLQLSVSNPAYFCRALSKRSETHPTLLLPKLERLVLYSTQFLHSQHPFRSSAFQQIESWLRSRGDRGYKLSTLEFREAVNLQEGDLDMLRDCADEVIWDNEEQILDDPPRAVPAELSADDLEPPLLVDQAYVSEAGHQ